MAAPNYSFAKKQRELAKKQKKAEKLARKQPKNESTDEAGDSQTPAKPEPASS